VLGKGTLARQIDLIWRASLAKICTAIVAHSGGYRVSRLRRAVAEREATVPLCLMNLATSRREPTVSDEECELLSVP
jgi:hypothetical protein